MSTSRSRTPQNRIEIDPKIGIDQRSNERNVKAIDDQVERDEIVCQSEAIARGYPRIENSGLPLARAAGTDSKHQQDH